ncbi:MAG: hypothetical protein Q4G68_04720 [Planctomycetia bacterium]|nr:hypothetical protein [Planctomycetia bacterium]
MTTLRQHNFINGNREHRLFCFWVLLCLSMPWILSCGTTKWSDTSRTATEQLLITSAMEDVIDEFDFYPLTGRRVYINKEGVNCTDSHYLFSILHQQLAANGVLVQEKKDEADYILEIAPGAVGTNRYDLMYGVPETKVPSIIPVGGGSSIPEISIIKRTDQKAQVKLMMWAYNRASGAIIWQSGTKTKTASIRDRWFLGLGPITKSSFKAGMEVGGDEVDLPSVNHDYLYGKGRPSVKTEAVYRDMNEKDVQELEALVKRELPRNETGKGTDNEKEPNSSEEVAKTGSDASETGSPSAPAKVATLPGVESPAATKPSEGATAPASAPPSSPPTAPATPAAPASPAAAPASPAPVLYFDNMRLSLQQTARPQVR